MGNESSKNGYQQTEVNGLRELPSENGSCGVQGKDDLDLSKAASDPDPDKLRQAYLCSDHHLDETDKAALNINPKDYLYPFENIVLEGGGAKGIGYVGVIKCLEELNMMGQIKRIAGTSAGAIYASMIAVGYTWDEMEELTSTNLDNSYFDHSCGLFSLVPNLLKKYGWNPGHKFYNFFGMFINGKTGNPDTTFKELYKSTGVELCIVVTNLNLKTAQYCHVKTTPDMPIRTAIKFSMAIPGVFIPGQYVCDGSTDTFVDGGIIINYPINCFDGWYLSMKKEDSFLHRITSLDDIALLSAATHRSDATEENKTIGCLVYSDTEVEVQQALLEKRIGASFPEKPKIKTKILRKIEKKNKQLKEEEKEYSKTVESVQSFLKVLHKHNLDEDQHLISKDELEKALMDEGFPVEQQEVLFGKGCHGDNLYKNLDSDDNGQIEFNELVAFLSKRGIQIQRRAFQYRRDDICSFTSFLGAVLETMLHNSRYIVYRDEDIERTVGVKAGYVASLDFQLEDADRSFLIERGFNATMSFLRYYAVKNPTQVTQRQAAVQEQKTTTTITDLSESVQQ